MKQWNYAEAGEVKGPISQAELTERLENGSLPTNTPVWTEGQADWLPANQIGGLFDTSNLPIGADRHESATTELVDNSFEPDGEQIRPWIRYWARTFDFIGFCLLAGIVAGLIFPSAFEQLNDTAMGIIMLFIYILVEPLMLMTWGTTPGKFFFNIQLRNMNGSKLNYNQGLLRSAKVVLKGQGLGIPLVSLATLIYSYNHLEKEGQCSWDADGQHTIAHRQINGWRAAILILVALAFIGLIVVGAQSNTAV